MTSLDTVRLLARLGDAALSDASTASRTRTAHRLARRATAPSTDHETDAAITAELDARLDLLQRGGWSADDLDRVVRLRAGDTTAAAVLADHVARRGGEPWWRGGWLPARVDRSGAVETVVGAAALHAVLARLDLLPWFDPARGDDVDDGVLRKVRALLAKAESTDFTDEADALTTKAQELITRHALAGLDLDPHAGHELGSRRLALDAPYVNAKSILLTRIAQANRCRSVQCRFSETAVVIGTPPDLAAVEVLYTSLLTQATRAMLAAGSVADGRGRNRTRSFRQSFLVGFAGRIGERLAQADASATGAADLDGSLLPVLRARSEAVDAAVHEAFPGLVKTSVSSSNLAGHHAGDRAGSSADLHARRVDGPRGRLSA